MSRRTSRVRRGTFAFALHDQVIPSRPSRRAISSARGQVVRERVVVEEELPDLGEVPLGAGHLRFDARRATHAVAVPAHGLRPQAKGALGTASPPGVQRHIGVQQIADDVVLDRQVPPVHVDHEGQGVHVLDRRARRRESNAAPLPVRDAPDGPERAPLGDLGARVVELTHRRPSPRRAPRGATPPAGPPRARRPCRRGPSGFSSFRRSATRISLPKEGVLVCSTTWS